jgi:hypothetical protein
VVRYLEAYRMRAFSGITVLPRLSWDIKAKPWLVRRQMEDRSQETEVRSQNDGIPRVPY